MTARFIRLRAGHTKYERPDWLEPSIERLAYYRDGRLHDGSYPWGMFPSQPQVSWESFRRLIFREDVRTVNLRLAHTGIGQPLDFATSPKWLIVGPAPRIDLTVFPL